MEGSGECVALTDAGTAVSLLATIVCPATTDEPIEMSFESRASVGPRSAGTAVTATFTARRVSRTDAYELTEQLTPAYGPPLPAPRRCTVARSPYLPPSLQSSLYA